MTGQFTVVVRDRGRSRTTCTCVFELDDGAELRFRDLRRFGSAEWFADRVAVAAAMDRRTRPRAVRPRRRRTSATPFGGTARNLKAILLDQTVVAGVGNIYADEALLSRASFTRRGGDAR